MRCIWPTTASNAFHVLARRGAALPHGRAGLSRAVCRPSKSIGLLGLGLLRVSATSAALAHSHAGAADSVSVQDAVDAVSESSASLPNLLKPSKISFAAAQAIRMCIGNGGIADGFFVLNSIRYAAYRSKPSALPFKMPGILYSRVEFEAAALHFGPDVPQRLSAHVLLHGLIRNGLAEPAFELSKMMMAEGVVVRSTTLEAIIELLVSTGASSPRPKNRGVPFHSPSPTIPVKLASDVLMLRPSIMADQRTRLALKLLFLARRHRQRRTDNMFKLFMAASLLNGELIIFSLLFGWTCRDWQTSYSLASNLEPIPDDDEIRSSSQGIAASSRWAHLRSESIFPDKESLHSALSIINTILAREGMNPIPTHDRLVALQALGNLAGLLERKQIPFPEIEPLLRALYKCPRVEDEIWIAGARGCPERIKAYKYFHRVLSHLIKSLPRDKLCLRHHPVAFDAFVKNHHYRMLPPLDLFSYNALLHYALRHRLSPELGTIILTHMTKKRQEPLQPDTTTANILLRSGALMRRHDIVAEVLQSMGNPIFTPSIPIIPRTLADGTVVPPTENGICLDLIPVVQQRTELVMLNTLWGSKLARMSTNRIEIPDLPSTADIYTLTSYMAYLTSSGQPRAIKDLLFRVIPELNTSVYHISWKRPEDCGPALAARRAAIRRAITLGPVFFSAVLNALYKSQQPALAERVWQLAKKAERRSWARRLVPECEPWIFGPHVYTIMMKLYGYTARRREWISKLYMYRHNKRVDKRTSRDSVWTAFIYECQKLPKPWPAHELRVLLHRFMWKAALDTFRRFLGLRDEYARVWQLRKWLAKEDIPKPDARFFNAAIYAFRPRQSPPHRKAWYRQQIRRAQHSLEFNGVLPGNTGWNPALHEVAERMTEAGYGLPLGLQHMFVGRLDDFDLPNVRRPTRSPYAYRQQKHNQFLPYGLPTPRQKALPLSRTYAQRRKTCMDNVRGRGG
ncbi:hypothetical protein C8R43DRAFT_254029 [Mycena crocata]|nr:hypothetical protein C8R43DRAFT_254029 [Mycena crocata]